MALTFVLTFLLLCQAASAEVKPPSPRDKEPVIVDTDIGFDIDDAFAVALALRSAELEILGFSTAAGDTLARAKILDRMLGESGHENIPVAVGTATTTSEWLIPPTIMASQKVYGEGGKYKKASHPDAASFVLDQIRRLPGQVTLVAIGPLTNVGAMIDKDLATFRKIKRVVIMGGSFGTATDGTGQKVETKPEWNIKLDVPSAQKLFRSGVPIYVIPNDSTGHLELDEVKRRTIFTQGAPLTDALLLLYYLSGWGTPVMYDPMAIAFIVDPSLCPAKPIHVVVDDAGITRAGTDKPNAEICLRSDSNTFFDFYMKRLTTPGTE